MVCFSLVPSLPVFGYEYETKMQVDDKFYLYVDGNQKLTGDQWNRVYTWKDAHKPRILAIYAENHVSSFLMEDVRISCCTPIMKVRRDILE